MDKSEILGGWFSDQKELETEDGDTVETRTLHVTQYLKNGALNSEGHCIIKRLSNGDKTEIFIKLDLSGSWQLDENSIFEKVENVNLNVEEVFLNDLLITTDEICAELKLEMLKLIPIGKTIEMTIISATDNKIIYEQVDANGNTNIHTMIKTLKSYSKYFS